MHLMVLKPVAIMRFVYKNIKLCKILGGNWAQTAGY